MGFIMKSTTKLTNRQEKFAINLFSGMTNREAYKIAYHANYAHSTIDANASRLAHSDKVLCRLEELKKQAASSKIMSVQERKERLSEIARGNLTDYQEAGLDGAGYISITKNSPNTAAIASIESATKFDESGNTGMLITKVRLHSPIQAISELNKMEKIYSESINVNVDNRKLIVVTSSEKSKELTEAIAAGEGTE